MILDDETIRAKLAAAFAQARVAALHVDLQNGFYGHSTATAFESAGKFSRQMRVLGVRNFWAIYTDRWHADVNRNLPAPVSYMDRIQYFHDSIMVLPDEIVFEKMDQGLFARNVKPRLVLNLARIDTLLITGVRHNGCVSDTAAGAAQCGFDTYVVMDATDRHMSDFERYEHFLCDGLDADVKTRLSVVNSHTVYAAMTDKGLPAREQENIACHIG